MSNSANSYQSLRTADLPSVRAAIRSNAYTGHTAGLARLHLQANLAIMPVEYALDFMRFCQRNPKPCPLVGVSDTGNPMMFTLGEDIDIRTDVPAYNIYRDGRLEGSTNDISDLWHDSFVAFALGCSFTFEDAIQRAGVPLWHIEKNKVAPMFRSNIQTIPAGPFCGEMVASMRAIPDDQLALVKEISRRYALAHGAPIHSGNPATLGIADIAAPDWGDAAPVEAGQTAVFWACGVTPQVAIEYARIPICITHKPGHMLITDVDGCCEIPIVKNPTNGRVT